jgi:hypothetical protein
MSVITSLSMQSTLCRSGILFSLLSICMAAAASDRAMDQLKDIYDRSDVIVEGDVSDTIGSCGILKCEYKNIIGTTRIFLERPHDKNINIAVFSFCSRVPIEAGKKYIIMLSAPRQNSHAAKSALDFPKNSQAQESVGEKEMTKLKLQPCQLSLISDEAFVKFGEKYFRVFPNSQEKIYENSNSYIVSAVVEENLIERLDGLQKK